MYYNVLKETEGTDAEVCALTVAGNIKALMIVTIMQEPGIKGFFSRRGIIFGGPVLNDITDDECNFFFKEVCKQLKGEAIYLETRNLFDYSEYKKSIMSSDWAYKPHLNFQLSLKILTKDKLLGVFDNDVRRRIKNSLSEGATYSECKSEIELHYLYNILLNLYNKKIKLPLPEFDFFKKFYNSGLMKVFIVKYNSQVIGGSFCPFDKNGIYTLYYCDRRVYNRKISPTHLSILAAMEFGIEHNILKFDFMGAGKPGIPFGVRDFKKQFGGKQVEHGRFIKVLNPFLYKIGKVGLKILSKYS